MNVFEALGLPADHRPENKAVQLVKHYGEVNEKKLHAKLVNKELGLQLKVDGVFCMLIKQDGKCLGMFSRTGRQFANSYELGELFCSRTLADGVYIGEFYHPALELMEFSGMINPNRVNALSPREYEHLTLHAEFHVHDYLSVSAFLLGYSPISYINRYTALASNVLPSERMKVIPLLQIGVAGSEDADRRIEETLAELVADGEEGVCIKPLHADYVAGAKDWHCMKRVRDIEYDLECIGIEEGKGKYAGHAANLKFRWRGGDTIIAMLGKGWTMADAFEIFNKPELVIGKVFRVYALQESSKGKLRNVKVGEERIDKNVGDY